MSTHAIRSPSGAHGWMKCRDWTSNPVGSEAADEGTAAHFLAEQCLTAGVDAVTHKGARIGVPADAGAFWGDAAALGNGRTFEVTDEMVEAVQKYLDLVRSLGGTLMIEQRLPISQITGESDAYGTSDAVVLLADEIVVVDLKYGANPRNKVDAQDNEQGGIYMCAALDEFSLLGEFKRTRFMIVQPRVDHVSEWDLTLEELEAFRATVKPADVVAPGTKQCHWCARKANCAAYDAFVADAVGAEFDNIANIDMPDADDRDDLLSTKMAAVDLIEAWCKAVRAEVERRLLTGVPVPGYKLVEGRRGARAWSDPEAAEKLLRETFRLPVEKAYDMKLISPTTAEKLAKSGEIGPRQWPKAAALITQSQGSPSVAPESDKRPALVVTPTADEFEDVSAEGLV